MALIVNVISQSLNIEIVITFYTDNINIYSEGVEGWGDVMHIY